MKILDRPQLSINPKPTKRKLFILVIVVFSFGFSLLGFLLFELLDKTIKYPKRAEVLTGLKVAGACTMAKSANGINLNTLRNAGLKAVSESILKARSKHSEATLFVQFFSHWQNEGKTHIINEISNKIKSFGYECTRLDLNQINTSNKEKGETSISGINKLQTYESFIQYYSDLQKADIVLIEVPAASSETFNTALLNSAQLSFLIADARRNWESADDYLLRNKKEEIDSQLECILNYVHPREMNSITGYSVKKKWFQTVLKRR